MRAFNSLSPGAVFVVVAFATIAQLAPAAHAQQEFRFLCDGIDANGNPSGDGCGTCNSTTAARWNPAVVPYSYDKNTLPSGARGVSATRWNAEIAAARQSWMSVSSLQLSDDGRPAIREFGVDNGSNAIFWVVNATDWANQGLDQDSLNNALGVTITINDRCRTGGNSISDADTVMNGIQFNWSANSSRSTLAHEMGHGLGLGHPCTGCGALMSAVSSGGFSGCGNDTPDTCGDPLVPQNGDIQGIQLLYPAPGLLGSPCAGNGDCDSGDCLTVDGASFCSQACTGTCGNGMVCANAGAAGQQCVFSSSGIAQPGETCDPPGCVSACQGANIGPGCNTCLDAGNSTNQCFAGCNASTGAGCSGNDSCAPVTGQNIPANAGVCVPGGSALKGQACGQNTACVAGLECVLETATDGFCRATCDGTTGAGCDNTENCLALFGDGTAACFPHGSVAEGGACTSGGFDQCGRGLICLNDNICHGICSQGYACSDPAQTCQALQGGLSVCVGGTEGEGEGSVGEGEGEGAPPGGCRITRGNFDCPNPADACVVASPNDLVGTCTGNAGSTKTFDICKTDDECTTGLCLDGVCSRPCDQGACPSGFECDAGKAPAGDAGGEPGLCVPQSCRDDHSVCDAASGFHCVYNETSHYTCAKDGNAVCGCTATTSSSPATSGIAALLGLLAIAVPRGPRQRRHSRQRR